MKWWDSASGFALAGAFGGWDSLSYLTLVGA